MTTHATDFRSSPFALAVMALLLGISELHAGTTDIAQSPMANSSATAIKPNIMLILDNSGSMASDYMPDSVSGDRGKRCFGSYAHNTVFYNPNYTYTPPVLVDASGNVSTYPNSSFTNAWNDGFHTGSGTKNLSNLNNLTVNAVKVNPSCNNNCTTTKYYYSTYTGNGSASTCNSDSTYTITTSLSTAAEQTNYANWYSYYRTRTLMMRSAAGKAFANLDDTYRVGFSVIKDSLGDDNTTDSTGFRNTRDFDATQRAVFYSSLYADHSSSWTPLRGALSKIGRYYAKKVPGQSTDPVQYSCQQNFAILTTDGYWNTEEETPTYKALGLTGSDVGNQDNDSTLKANSDTAAMYDQWKSKSNAWCSGQTGGTGASNTLADVAMYYYKTDLRTSDLNNCTGALGNDVCENNVLGTTKDAAVHQHMTTFTVGLGVDGTLAYSEDYEQGGSADYNAIKNGTKVWPNPIGGSGNACDAGERIDDLWHAAVNGRGSYYSAKNPGSVIAGLSKALAGVAARKGAAAAAATSNLEPVAGDDFVYVALYRTVKWDGDLKAYEIDPDLGTLKKDATGNPIELWSAQKKLDDVVAAANAGADGRTIYLFKSTAATKLRTFDYANLTSTEKGYFDNLCGSTVKLSQCADLSASNKTLANDGSNVIKYLRGQNTYEDESNNASRLFRDREHVLGDLVNSMPVYVKAPPFVYTDAGYDDFKKAQASRSPTVYVSGNDGMLHAFNGADGTERWAYIPTVVIPDLYRLADFNYSNNHRYFVDGSPTAGDIYTGSAWKTILVGGLNAGGRGIYALDITDPGSPKGLWEFSVSDDSDLGLTFGNPIVTKRKDGKWIVAIASGYNNVAPGDGKGYVYILDAATGTLLDKIGTNEGSTSAPSGLAKLNAWVDDVADNTAKRLYGGDLLGNLWRIDFDDNVDPGGKEAVQLASFKVGGKEQPITIRPELGVVKDAGTTYNAVYVATGRYLGNTDRADTTQQSIYAIKESLTSTGIGNARSGGQLVQQTLSESVDGITGKVVRTVTSNPVDWMTKSGWYVDLNPANASPGERVNIDMSLQLGTLSVVSNVPDDNACNVGGYSWGYKFSQAGTCSGDSCIVGEKLTGNALAVGSKLLKLANGKIIRVTTLSDGTLVTDELKNFGAGTKSAKRTSWRELVD